MKFRLILATGCCVGLLTVCAKQNATDITPTVMVEEEPTNNTPAIQEITEPVKPENVKNEVVPTEEPVTEPNETTDDWTNEVEPEAKPITTPEKPVVKQEETPKPIPAEEVVEAEPDYITTTDEATGDEPEYELEEEFPFPEEEKVCHHIGDQVSVQVIKNRVIVYKSKDCDQTTVACFVNKNKRKKTHCIFDEKITIMIHENDSRLTKFKKERRGNHD